jgi:hypothetical protein
MFWNFIEHNEQELALGELAYIGDERHPPPRFWQLLWSAAELLELTPAGIYGDEIALVRKYLSD